MQRMPAVLIFLGICLVLAALLVARMIRPVVSGAIFAVALITLGGFSRGFRK